MIRSSVTQSVRFINYIVDPMKNLTKVLATGAIAVLLMPTLALAHDKGTQVRLGASIEHRLEKLEKGEHKKFHKAGHASTTAAVITKQAVRVQTAADTMLSFNDRIGALIASSSVEQKAALEAKFTVFTSGAASAKVEAGSAISGAAQVNANNSTTTNAALLAAAKVDLREARGFLHDAQKALMQILRTLWIF